MIVPFEGQAPWPTARRQKSALQPSNVRHIKLGVTLFLLAGTLNRNQSVALSNSGIGDRDGFSVLRCDSRGSLAKIGPDYLPVTRLPF